MTTPHCDCHDKPCFEATGGDRYVQDVGLVARYATCCETEGDELCPACASRSNDPEHALADEICGNAERGIR